jgi:hypothetical protein
MRLIQRQGPGSEHISSTILMSFAFLDPVLPLVGQIPSFPRQSKDAVIVSGTGSKKDVDARHKAGQDEQERS